MKKIISMVVMAVLVGVMMFSMSACGKKVAGTLELPSEAVNDEVNMDDVESAYAELESVFDDIAFGTETAAEEASK